MTEQVAKSVGQIKRVNMLDSQTSIAASADFQELIFVLEFSPASAPNMDQLVIANCIFRTNFIKTEQLSLFTHIFFCWLAT